MLSHWKQTFTQAFRTVGIGQCHATLELVTERNGFDRYFAGKMKSPEFSAEYAKGRRFIDAIDRVVRTMPVESSDKSKLAFARRVRSLTIDGSRE